MTISNIFLEKFARLKVHLRWKKFLLTKNKEHQNLNNVSISLTSYPKRFETLDLTIKCLLTQSKKAREVILWIDDKDKGKITGKILSLCDYGLTIKYCDELKSYNKFVHAIRNNISEKIAICDDDTYYEETWLECMIDQDAPGIIPCHRIHKIKTNDKGMPLSYNNWDYESNDYSLSPLNFPTGVGGMLISKDKLDPIVTDSATFLKICPHADDIWLYFCGRKQGTIFKKINSNSRKSLITWRGSQDQALWKTNNVESGNDIQMKKMTAAFGKQW